MARPITRFAHNQCVECGADIGKVIYIRPFAKMCTDCKTNAWSGNAEVKKVLHELKVRNSKICLLYTSPSPRDATLSRMPSSA